MGKMVKAAPRTSKKRRKKKGPVYVKINEIIMKTKEMEIGKTYSVVYNGKEHHIIMPREGIVEIYKAINPLWIKLAKHIPFLKIAPKEEK